MPPIRGYRTQCTYKKKEKLQQYFCRYIFITSSFRRFASYVNTLYPLYKMTVPGVFNCNIFGLYESNILGFAMKNCPHNASLFRQSFKTTTCSAATFDRFNTAKHVQNHLQYIPVMTRFFNNFFHTEY